MVDIIITPLMHGFAEYHSWESKQKGLAGMAENVKRGFRAGGRAPYGYRLKHEPTGATRDGQPVTKSRLELAPEGRAPPPYSDCCRVSWNTWVLSSVALSST